MSASSVAVLLWAAYITKGKIMYEFLPQEKEDLREAQQEAWNRYRQNYNKRTKKPTGKAGPFSRWISRFYVLALIIFVASILFINVLPNNILAAVMGILSALSIFLITLLRKRNVRKGARGFAAFLAMIMIFVFGTGSVYALETFSFLSTNSVPNENRVSSIIKDPFNVCITGIDTYGTIDEQGRSDVNMIVTVNPQTSQILLTSIPRDYEIYLSEYDFAIDKLTHTGFYNVATTVAAEEDLLNTKINYFVKINFSTVKTFIDAIGGVDVYSEYEFTPVKKDDWTVQEGMNHMNGKQALAFARERKAFIDGDRQRIKNQQAVFEAIIKKATSKRTMALNYTKLLTSLNQNFEMDFSPEEMSALAKYQLAKNPEWKIFKNTITGGDGSMPLYSTGGAYAYVMTQDEESIEHAQELISAVLEGKELEKDKDDDIIIKKE